MLGEDLEVKKMRLIFQDCHLFTFKSKQMKLVTNVTKGTHQCGVRIYEDYETKREVSSSYRGTGNNKEKTKDIKRKRVQQSLERIEDEFFRLIRTEELVCKIAYCRAERAARQREARRAKRKSKK